MASEPTLLVSENYHQMCETAINRQINMELYASYAYLSMAFNFDRKDIALKNFATYFLNLSRKQDWKVETLLWLQNHRGGRIHLSDIETAYVTTWRSGLQATDYTFHLAQNINHRLLKLHWMAIENRDMHLCDFLESHFLHEHMRAVKTLGNLLYILHKLWADNPQLADYLFHKFNLDDSTEPKVVTTW